MFLSFLIFFPYSPSLLSFFILLPFPPPFPLPFLFLFPSFSLHFLSLFLCILRQDDIWDSSEVWEAKLRTEAREAVETITNLRVSNHDYRSLPRSQLRDLRSQLRDLCCCFTTSSLPFFMLLSYPVSYF